MMAILRACLTRAHVWKSFAEKSLTSITTLRKFACNILTRKVLV